MRHTYRSPVTQVVTYHLSVNSILHLRPLDVLKSIHKILVLPRRGSSTRAVFLVAGGFVYTPWNQHGWMAWPTLG